MFNNANRQPCCFSFWNQKFSRSGDVRWWLLVFVLLCVLIAGVDSQRALAAPSAPVVKAEPQAEALMQSLRQAGLGPWEVAEVLAQNLRDAGWSEALIQQQFVEPMASQNWSVQDLTSQLVAAIDQSPAIESSTQLSDSSASLYQAAVFVTAQAVSASGYKFTPAGWTYSYYPYAYPCPYPPYPYSYCYGYRPVPRYYPYRFRRFYPPRFYRWPGGVYHNHRPFFPRGPHRPYYGHRRRGHR